MDGFFGVENEQIGRLDPAGAVRLFRDLLWAEARRLAISPEIRISERTTVADGGIDASVTNNETETSELIKPGYSGYQIKTGTTFTLTEGELKKELFGQGNEVAAENLGSSVRSCLDAGGHLTFVCFGLDPVESQINTAHDLVTSWLTVCGYPAASVRFWGQTSLKGFLNDFPSLRLKVNGRGGGGVFEIIESWKSHADMKPDVLSLGTQQQDVIAEMRSQLLGNSEAVHLRIIGESGVGKTRLVLEALNDERLSPLVIYSDKPHELERQGLPGYLAMSDNHMEVVLVLDECSFDTAAWYWNRLQGLGKRVRLVTIHNEEHAQNGTTRLILLPKLEQAQIAEILTQYGIPQEHLARWASSCGGSPRWAKMVGENMRSNARDLLADPDTVSIETRCIAGADNINDQAVRERIVIMRFLSLFKKFGVQAPVSGEADVIYGLIHEYEPAISRARFDESIRILHDRRILQGERTYYITPKLLQVRMWVEWWRNHSAAFDLDKFNKLPPMLVEGFNDMFRFAQESEAALQTVEQLLGPNGPFADGSLLKQERGGTFFLALTEGAPEKALERLEATVGSWSDEQLREFKKGRREVIWALERIAVWEGLFARAAHLLLKLALTENDNVYSNNATGTFKEFFSLVSVTEEAPSKRLPIIEELLHSGVEAKEELALKAISIALEDHFVRMIGREYQGLRREPHIWEPRGDNTQEAQAYVTCIWDLLVEALSSKHSPVKKEAAKELSHQLEVRGRIPGTSKMALETARKVLSDGNIDRNKLIEVTVHILHYGKNELSDDLKQLWQGFYSELVPDNLSSLINRHVALNLLEDLFETGTHSEEKKNKTIKELAVRTYADPEALREELPWLVTERAGNGHFFGYELGKLDTDRHLLPEILDARRHASTESRPTQFFIGGYLQAFKESDPHGWEKFFEELKDDKTFLPLTAELAWRGGITDKIAENLITLTESGVVDAAQMMHFKYGTDIRKLGEEVFHRLIKSLLSHKKKDIASVALDIFGRYYTDKDSGHDLPKELTLELLTDSTFFEVSDGYRDTMDSFLWAQVAEKFIDKFGEDKENVLKIGLLMLNSIGNDGSILDHTDREIKAVLSRISEAYPDEMWTRALTLLEEKGYFIFKHWLSSNEFFHGNDQSNIVLLQKIKLETLWQWIDQDPDKRAWFVAAMVPNTFGNTAGEVSLAREILMRYGEHEEVRRNLTANFFSEGWMGKTSAHYTAKLEDIVKKRAVETHPKVIIWLDEYIQRLKSSIEAAKVEEERDDFWHND